MPSNRHNTRAFRIQFTRNKMNEDREYLFNAVLAIYSMQTAQEQAWRNTINRNGCGFNSSDARRGSRMARKIMASRDVEQATYRNGGREIHMYYVDDARRWMRKYAGQLVRLGFDGTTILSSPLATDPVEVGPGNAINSTDTRAQLIDNTNWCDPNCERCATFTAQARRAQMRVTFQRIMRDWRYHRTNVHTRAVNPPYVPAHVQRARRQATPSIGAQIRSNLAAQGRQAQTEARRTRNTERTGKEIFDALGIPCEERAV